MSSQLGPLPGNVTQIGDNEESAIARLKMIEESWTSRAEMVLDFLSHFPRQITKSDCCNPMKEQSWEERLRSLLMTEE